MGISICSLIEAIAEELSKQGIRNIVMHNVSHTSHSFIIADVFKYKGLIEVIADKLKQYKAANIVLDTSIVSSSGRRMVGNKSEMIITNKLFPLASLILPSISEAESLSGIKIDSIEDMGAAAGIISQKYGVKGIFFREGHKITEKGDMLFDDGKIFWLPHSCEAEKRTLGKGCALSASAACHLAMGDSLYESVKEAKTYVNGAAMSCLELGKGRNPLNQTFVFDN